MDRGSRTKAWPCRASFLSFLIASNAAFLLVSCAAVDDTPRAAESESAPPTLEALRGTWLGAVELPGGRQLRMGVEILRKADDSIGASFASLDQGARYLPVRRVSLDGGELTVLVDSPALTITGTLADDLATIDGRIAQGNAFDPIVFERVAAFPATGEMRPQTPRPPFPYLSEEVRIHNAEDDVWLSGTLSRPSASEAVPAVVFVGGSGPSYRDYEDHQLPLVLADYLARRGIAVLRYDKRGVYRSTGRYSTATEADFARDAAAAYRYLAGRPADIDSSRVGFIGHSEGSQVAARAMAEMGAAAAFIVSMAGVGLPPVETTVLQDGTETAAEGATAEEVVVLTAFSSRFYRAAIDESDEGRRPETLRALYDELSGREREIVIGWYGEYGSQAPTLNVNIASREAFVSDMRLPGPAVYWAEIDVPILLLFGGKDSQVPANEHVAGITRALDGRPVDSRIFPEKNHLFQTAVTGGVDEYGEIDETISPDVLAYIADWLEHRSGGTPR